MLVLLGRAGFFHFQESAPSLLVYTSELTTCRATIIKPNVTDNNRSDQRIPNCIPNFHVRNLLMYPTVPLDVLLLLTILAVDMPREPRRHMSEGNRTV